MYCIVLYIFKLIKLTSGCHGSSSDSDPDPDSRDQDGANLHTISRT